VLDILELPDSLTDELSAQDKVPAEALTDMLPISDQLPAEALPDPELVKELLAVSDTAELTEL